MNDKKLIVFWENKVLAIVHCTDRTMLIDTILDWYAEAYAFDRSKLSGAWVSMVVSPY
jgi:hypothetical protein